VNTLLEVRDMSLSVATGHVIQGRKTVLNHIDFSVARGSATAYLGANGAGKTSTFRILCGLCRRESGQVFFDNVEVEGGLPPSRFGFMPEQPCFYRNLTPFELLRGLGRLSAVSQQELTSRIHKWAERLAFTKQLHQPLHACSKGQVQRVGLAQALLHEPEFILLDEPLSGLDPMGREQVKQVLRDIHAQGATLLFSSHILSDAEAICDAVVVLDGGQIVHQGKLADLIDGNRWVVEIEGNASAFADFDGVKSAKNRTRFVLDNEAQRDTLIVRILASGNCRLLAVEQERKSLEDAFVSLLREEEKR